MDRQGHRCPAPADLFCARSWFSLFGARMGPAFLNGTSLPHVSLVLLGKTGKVIWSAPWEVITHLSFVVSLQQFYSAG